jgi:FAD/FMN-containing dehydrogenase
MRAKEEALAGWGRYPVITTRSFRPERVREAATALGGFATGIARGLGRSYGDAALNPEAVVRTGRLNRFLDFDAETGRLTCEAGVSLDELLEVFVPRGWFVPVSPGTRWVTVGGCIACDVHGKDHHHASTFGRHVDSLRLLAGRGELLACSPEQHADLSGPPSAGWA